MSEMLTRLRPYIPENWPIPGMVASNPWKGMTHWSLPQLMRFLASSPRLSPQPDVAYFTKQLQEEDVRKWAQEQGKNDKAYIKLWHFIQDQQANRLSAPENYLHQTEAWQHFEQWLSQELFAYIQNNRTQKNGCGNQSLYHDSDWETEELLALLWPMKGWLGLAKWLEDNRNHPAWIDLPSLGNLLTKMVFLLETYPTLYPKNDLDLRECLRQKPHFPTLSELGFNSDDMSLAHWDYFDVFAFLQELLEFRAARNVQKLLQKKPRAKTNCLAQWICCIDVRSESLRRALERDEYCETFGFAGFFGVAVALAENNKRTWRCPALISPNKTIYADKVEKRSLFYPKQQNFLSALGWFDLQALPRTLTLLKSTLYSWRQPNTVQTTPITRMSLASSEQNYWQYFTLDEALHICTSALKSIGLTQDFAPFVVVTAHKASSCNNPYHSTLECGACGGNSGELNAAILAFFMNDEQVRQGLKTHGIHIPHQTEFVAACHDTTTQRLYLQENLQQNGLFPWLEELVKRTESLLQNTPKLDPNTRSKTLRANSFDELNPDWALVNNFAMVVGKRELTRFSDFNGEVFLHSYDHTLDEDGTILESIMTAPLIVAHQINMQYLSASLYPKQFSSDSKALHSLIPGVGNLVGDGFDLALGLPKQSLFWQGNLMHSPRRLQVFIDAPVADIMTIIKKHPLLLELWKNQWIRIYSIYEKTIRLC